MFMTSIMRMQSWDETRRFHGAESLTDIAANDREVSEQPDRRLDNLSDPYSLPKEVFIIINEDLTMELCSLDIVY